MPNDISLLIKILGYVGAASFCIIMFFVSVANYIIERRIIRIIEAIIFVLMVNIFMIRTLNTVIPPIIPDEFAALATGFIWLLVMIVVTVWSFFIGYAKWKSIMAAYSIRKMEKKLEERNFDNDETQTSPWG